MQDPVFTWTVFVATLVGLVLLRRRTRPTSTASRALPSMPPRRVIVGLREPVVGDPIAPIEGLGMTVVRVGGREILVDEARLTERVG